ncbi:MAG TPA: hypothetical protein VGM32_21555, partial [Rhodopila sp.]
MLQLFLPRSIPRTAIRIGHFLFLRLPLSAYADGRGGPSHKDLPAALAAIARDRRLDPVDIEVWFGDEARVGQKNKITRRWSLRGTR